MCDFGGINKIANNVYKVERNTFKIFYATRKEWIEIWMKTIFIYQ